MTAETAAPRRRGGIITIVLCVIILLLAGACAYLFWRYRQTAQKQAATPTAQIDRLTAQLQGTFLLPSEQPSLATVLDRTKLGNAQLVAEAHNNDQLLIYPKARRLILYRPSAKKVIDMFHVEAEQSGTPSGTNKTQ